MGNSKSTKILTGNCTTERINVDWNHTFNVHPNVHITPVCKYSEPFFVRITEIDKNGFRFECLKLNGEPVEKNLDFFQWTAISPFE